MDCIDRCLFMEDSYKKWLGPNFVGTCKMSKTNCPAARESLAQAAELELRTRGSGSGGRKLKSMVFLLSLSFPARCRNLLCSADFRVFARLEKWHRRRARRRLRHRAKTWFKACLSHGGHSLAQSHCHLDVGQQILS